MEPKSIFHSHSIPTGAFTYIYFGRDLRSVEDEDEETFQYCKSEGRMGGGWFRLGLDLGGYSGTNMNFMIANL